MNAQVDASDSLTANRREVKYILPLASARRVIDLLQGTLPRHKFAGPGANRLPGARHYVTTIYFDTPDGRLQERARTDPDSLKLRAKQYYDKHPGLAQVVKDPKQLTWHSAVLWLELKSTSGARSRKMRVGLHPSQVSQLFGTGFVTPHMLASQRRFADGEGAEMLRELANICGGVGAPLRPRVAVNYQRIAWQRDGLRVTVDRDLAFFRPPLGVLSGEGPVMRGDLGELIERPDYFLLEIKALDEIPDFLYDVVRNHVGHPVAFSKFVCASEAVRPQ